MCAFANPCTLMGDTHFVPDNTLMRPRVGFSPTTPQAEAGAQGGRHRCHAQPVPSVRQLRRTIRRLSHQGCGSHPTDSWSARQILRSGLFASLFKSRPDDRIELRIDRLNATNGGVDQVERAGFRLRTSLA